MTDIGHQLLDVPFGGMVSTLALAIAEAQYELDMTGVRIAEMMSGVPIEDENDPEADPAPVEIAFGLDDAGKPVHYSLLELGFTPTFYQFVDTIIEVKLSISMSSERKHTSSRKSTSFKASGGFFLFGGGMRATATTVSASYAAKYNYSAEGSCLLRTKLVPVPPPAILEERIRRSLEPEPEGE